MNPDYLSVTVAKCWEEAFGIKCFELHHEHGEALPAWNAGDHVDVELPSGLIRQYSLCGALDAANYRIAVQREAASRGGSRYLCDHVSEGDRLRISMPKSNFALEADTGGRILLAGGIGVTPLFAMAQQLLRDGMPFELHYFARSRENVAFLSELTTGELSVHVQLHLGATADQATMLLRKILLPHSRKASLYYCGPTGFMAAIQTVVSEQDWAPSKLHFEYFSPPEEPEGGAPSAKAFLLRVASLDREFLVPGDKTPLQVLTECGVKVPNSCQQGTCGSCVVKVIEGVPEHHDYFLSDFHKNAGKKIALCVSRAKTDTLVVDF